MPRQRLFERDPPTAVEEGDAEGFEDVGLNDDNKLNAPPEQAPLPPQPKKRGFFSKFSDHNQESGGISPVASPSPTSMRFSTLLPGKPGRKRGQSGQGAELGQMDRPGTAQRDSMVREMTDAPTQA